MNYGPQFLIIEKKAQNSINSAWKKLPNSKKILFVSIFDTTWHFYYPNKYFISGISILLMKYYGNCIHRTDGNCIGLETNYAMRCIINGLQFCHFGNQVRANETHKCWRVVNQSRHSVATPRTKYTVCRGVMDRIAIVKVNLNIICSL